MSRPAISSDRDMSATDCLDMALYEERLARDCGPHDPAYRLLLRERDWWLNEACRLELSN